MNTRLTILTIIAALSLTIGLGSCSLMSGAKYKKAIEHADKNFNEKQYTDAKIFYTQAQDIKPKDEYATQKIKDIDNIIKAQSIATQYKKTLAEADKLFEQESYSDAKTAYLKASKLNTKEKYPKEQINKIDAILAEIQAQKEFLNNPYHIVIGCFAVKANASKLNEKLISEGYKSRIIPMYSGKYNAVTINSFSGNSDAYNNLNSTKEKFQGGAWVYKK